MIKGKVFNSKKYNQSCLNYLEYSPDAHEEKLPLLIYLHGAGTRGNDFSQMRLIEPIKELKNGRRINAVIVAPQCYAETWFDLFGLLSEFIETAINQENIDRSRVYITGVSMGAYATWQMCISHPDWFAAVVPVCGGGMYWDAERLKDLPIWAFHGALDTVVFPEESIKMVSAINKNGGNAKLTILPKDDHNAWDSTFACDEMWKWLFSQKK